MSLVPLQTLFFLQNQQKCNKCRLHIPQDHKKFADLQEKLVVENTLKKFKNYLGSKLLLITIEFTYSVEFQEGNFVGVRQSKMLQNG